MRGQQQNATDQTANFFWVLVIIVAVFLITWWLARQWIVLPVYLVRYYEMDLVKYVLEAWASFANILHLPTPNTSELDVLQKYIMLANPKSVLFSDFTKLNVYVGNWVRYPSVFILFILAFVIHFRHVSTKYRQVYSMDSLKKLEVENWPQITPVLSLDLVKEDPEKGPWAMTKRPLDFCKENNLLSVEVVNGKSEWGLSRGPAARVFALQLGSLWKEPQTLPIHIKALLVIFLARADNDRDVAKRLLGQISASAACGKLDFTGVEDLLKKYQNSHILKWLTKRHAYVYTMMATLLEIARTDGVLASAEFLWLKPVDRRLWYVLNSVGRQTAVVEVAGVFAHWIAEKKIGRALKTPMVKEAVTGLEQAIKETLYIGEGERWHTINVA